MVQRTLERPVSQVEDPTDLVEYIAQVFDGLAAALEDQSLEKIILRLFRSSRKAIAEECEITKEMTKLRVQASELRGLGASKMDRHVRELLEVAAVDCERTNGRVLSEAFHHSLMRHPHLKPLLCHQFRHRA